MRLMSGENDPLAKRAAAEAELAATKARVDAIRAKIVDPESHPADLGRLIASEIATVAMNMRSADPHIVKAFAAQVKALRTLSKQLMTPEVWSKKDIVNFDGEKFKFVLSKIEALFVDAMEEGGMPEDQRTSVMKHYRDLVAVEEPRIRRETKELGSKKRT